MFRQGRLFSFSCKYIYNLCHPSVVTFTGSSVKLVDERIVLLKRSYEKKQKKTDSIITRPWKLSRKFCTVTSFHSGDGGLEPLIKSPSFLEAPSPLIMENFPKISWSRYFSEHIFRSFFSRAHLIIYLCTSHETKNLETSLFLKKKYITVLLIY